MYAKLCLCDGKLTIGLTFGKHLGHRVVGANPKAEGHVAIIMVGSGCCFWWDFYALCERPEKAQQFDVGQGLT